jgi:hypothetical protein
MVWTSNTLCDALCHALAANIWDVYDCRRHAPARARTHTHTHTHTLTHTRDPTHTHTHTQTCARTGTRSNHHRPKCWLAHKGAPHGWKGARGKQVERPRGRMSPPASEATNLAMMSLRSVEGDAPCNSIAPPCMLLTCFCPFAQPCISGDTETTDPGLQFEDSMIEAPADTRAAAP